MQTVVYFIERCLDSYIRIHVPFILKIFSFQISLNASMFFFLFYSVLFYISLSASVCFDIILGIMLGLYYKPNT